jgi:23S rRNA (cytidine2498-2'-O)-methyltransferase
LSHGLKVVGIDPAQVDPRVIAQRDFQHVQKRADDVRRREFRGIAWLTADMNVAPESMLDTVEAIVTHPSTNIRGLLLTLKLLDWNLADHVDEYLERIRSWGYRQVRARQLVHNRQEICVAATGRRVARRKARR